MPISDYVSLAIDRWREDLERASGRDSLVGFTDNSESTLDLAHAHPNGLAQFLAGRPTQLSSLFRQPFALAESRGHARAIRTISDQLLDRHGVNAAHLVSGVARWTITDRFTGEPSRFKAPILLHPVSITPSGAEREDEALHMFDKPHVNPTLVRLLRENGVNIDPEHLTSLAMTDYGFSPRPAYEYLRDIAMGLADFSVLDRTIVGIFFDVVPALLEEFTTRAVDIESHPVLHRVAELESQDMLGQRAAGEAPSFDALPDVAPTSLAVPLDPHQTKLVAAARSRQHVRVLAGPGSGVTQVLTQLAIDAATNGKSMLVVAPRPRDIVELGERLTSLGLSHILDDAANMCENVIDVTEQTPVAPANAGSLPSSTAIAENIVRQRNAAHTTTVPWDVSIADAIDQLTLLTGTPGMADVSTRLTGDVARAITPALRDELRAKLHKLHDLKGFTPEVRSSPWWGITSANGNATTKAIDAAARLDDGRLSSYIKDVSAVASSVGLTEPTTLRECAELIDLMRGVNKTLELFLEEVYQRPIDQMVAGTATPQWRSENDVSLSMGDRRRLRRQAKSFVRHRASVEDLHAALEVAAKERSLWQQKSRGGGWPQATNDVAELVSRQASLHTDIAILDEAFGNATESLTDKSLGDVSARITALHSDDYITTLAGRVDLTRELESHGLTALLDEIHTKGLSGEHVIVAFDTCWWQSVLSTLLEELSAAQTADELATTWKTSRDAELGRSINAASGPEAAGACIAVTPLRMPELLGDRTFDTVVVVAAHSCAVPEGVLGLARGRQAIVIGDPDGMQPRGLDESVETADLRQSLLVMTHETMPTIQLGYQHRMPQQLAELATHVSPWSVPAPFPAVTMVRVPSRTHIKSVEGDSPIAEREVDMVVEMVMQHVRNTPEDTLAVIAMSRDHARHIAEAMRARLLEHPAVVGWFSAKHPERFIVTDMHRSEDVVRDRIIVSLGLNPTADRPLQYALKDVDRPGADRSITCAFTRARRNVTVTSCVEADDIIELAPPTAMNVSLSRALRAMADPTVGPESVTGGLPPAVHVFASMLGRVGFDVLSTGGTHGWPDLAVSTERGVVAICTDTRWQEAMGGNERTLEHVLDDLAIGEHLDRFGWHTSFISSVDMFRQTHQSLVKVVGEAGAKAAMEAPAMEAPAPETSAPSSGSSRKGAAKTQPSATPASSSDLAPMTEPATSATTTAPTDASNNKSSGGKKTKQPRRAKKAAAKKAAAMDVTGEKQDASAGGSTD